MEAAMPHEVKDMNVPAQELFPQTVQGCMAKDGDLRNAGALPGSAEALVLAGKVQGNRAGRLGGHGKDTQRRRQRRAVSGEIDVDVTRDGDVTAAGEPSPARSVVKVLPGEGVEARHLREVEPELNSEAQAPPFTVLKVAATLSEAGADAVGEQLAEEADSDTLKESLYLGAPLSHSFNQDLQILQIDGNAELPLPLSGGRVEHPGDIGSLLPPGIDLEGEVQVLHG
jgi:hypothetical protein